MRDEIAEMYDGLELDGDSDAARRPRRAAARLHGAFIVGLLDGEPVCCGGVKRLDERDLRDQEDVRRPGAPGAGRGAHTAAARLNSRPATSAMRSLGWTPGPKQGNARGLYESEGYREVPDFNGNPVAVFWGEKPLNS